MIQGLTCGMERVGSGNSGARGRVLIGAMVRTGQTSVSGHTVQIKVRGAYRHQAGVRSAVQWREVQWGGASRCGGGGGHGYRGNGAHGADERVCPHCADRGEGSIVSVGLVQT